MTSVIILDLYEKYQKIVKENVQFVGEIEVALKWMSYFISGRGKGTSSIVAELAYSASNVLSLLNDSIIRKAVNELKQNGGRKQDEEPKFSFVDDDSLRFVLTLIEYLEVFAEITSSRMWGPGGKWFIIAIIQLCKTVLRLVLFLRYGNNILCSPLVSPMTVSERKNMFEQLSTKQMTEDESKAKDDDKRVQMTFTLKRSGRILRTVSSAPPVLGRTWKLPSIGMTNRNREQPDIQGEISTELKQLQVFAEALHTVRPILHLFSMLSFGSASWMQWLLSLGMDVTSLKLMGDQRLLNVKEQREMRFRKVALLYYLLRSPFYEKLSKETLEKVLGEVSCTVPLARYICKPLLDYLPAWQEVYFYSWGA